MSHVWLLIARGNRFGRTRQRRNHIGSLPLAFRWRTPLVLAKRLCQVLAPRQSGPLGPPRACSNGKCGANRLPLISGDYGNQIPFPHYFRGWKLLLVDLANGNERRAQRRRSHHSCMQHSRQRDVATPLRLAGYLVRNAGHRIGRPDDPELAYRFHGWVSGHGEAIERCNADPRGRIGFRRLTCNRNF